jgi:hypothetical protein
MESTETLLDLIDSYQVENDASMHHFEYENQYLRTEPIGIHKQLDTLRNLIHGGGYCLPIFTRFQTEAQAITLPVLDIENNGLLLIVSTPEGIRKLTLGEVTYVVTFVDANRKPVFLDDNPNKTEFSEELANGPKREAQYQREDMALASWLASREREGKKRQSLTCQTQNKEFAGEVTMKFKIVVATKQELGKFSDFIMRQLTRHFNEWIQEDKGGSFTLRWVKNNLIGETDSLYLLEQWQEKERHYVQYLIDLPITQEWAEEDALDEFMSAA